MDHQDDHRVRLSGIGLDLFCYSSIPPGLFASKSLAGRFVSPGDYLAGQVCGYSLYGDTLRWGQWAE